MYIGSENDLKGRNFRVRLRWSTLVLINRGFIDFLKFPKKIKEVLQILKFLIPNFELERKYMPCNKTNQKLIFWLVIHFFLKLLKSILKATHLPTLYTQQFVFNLCDRNNLKEK